MINYNKVLCLILGLLSACFAEKSEAQFIQNTLPPDVLNFHGIPANPEDRTGLAFSDQGAWFAYGLPNNTEYYGSFSGPFLMTQENGVWCSKSLSQLKLLDGKNALRWHNFTITQKSYHSHLEQILENEQLRIQQTLFFSSPHTALVTTEIQNLSTENKTLQPQWSGTSFLKNLYLVLKLWLSN